MERVKPEDRDRIDYLLNEKVETKKAEATRTPEVKTKISKPAADEFSDGDSGFLAMMSMQAAVEG